MANTVDLSGFDRLKARLLNIVNPDATDLMLSWMKIIDDDNRRGVMAGLDKDGVPMKAVVYRPAPTLPLGKVRTRGRGAYNPGVGGNLSPSEYRRLGGPPMAPRGLGSRVITNFRTRHGQISPREWEAVGYWDDVVSRDGTSFLMAHFTGARVGRGRTVQLPRRDLRGVRPEGVEKATRALRAWMISTIRSSE